jgi:hypothetical protein
MFTHKNLKLDGIEDFLGEIRQLDEMKNAGEDQEDKYTKKSGKTRLGRTRTCSR